MLFVLFSYNDTIIYIYIYIYIYNIYMGGKDRVNPIGLEYKDLPSL